MESDIKNFSVVDFAYQVIDMHEEIIRLRRFEQEAEYYKHLYFESLDSSISHSKFMMGKILEAALDPNSLINKGQQKMIEERFSSPQPSQLAQEPDEQ